MSVKIVTDSTSDLPKELAQELGITVVPLNVHFGLDTFRECRKSGSGHFFLRLEVFPQPRKSLGNGRFRELIKTFSAVSK